ncbi:MAG: PEP/pyruvate-binding domain-containing protein [Candidatus Micrarchaeota archaeon]
MSTHKFPSKTIGSVEKIGSGKVGGKGHNTWAMAHHLQSQGIARIPTVKMLATDVVSATSSNLNELSSFLSTVHLRSGYMAVRSSALCEDGAVSCAGVFDTKFLKYTGDSIELASVVQSVVLTSLSPACSAFVARNQLEPGLAILIQSVVGGPLSDQHFGPAFSGVLDTSSINGEGTLTLSFVLGLGTIAVGDSKSANTAILRRGHFGKNDFIVHVNQKDAEFLDASGKPVKLSVKRALELLNFSSMDEAVGAFLSRYVIPLNALSLILEPHFAPSPLDIEFATAPSKGKRLYVVQARPSHLSRAYNPDYPQNVNEQKILSVSRTVLGAVTVKAPMIVNYITKDYLDDAKQGFPSLLALDRLGKPYILIVPPEATSSQFENPPFSQLHNLCFVVEKLTDAQVHDIGLTGVDHMSRLLYESKVGYMEGYVNFERLRANSTVDRSIPHLIVYHGNFVAAVCGTNHKGVLFFN